MNKKQQSAQQTRQRIIDAAQNIISDEGVAALTSRKLIERANLSKGALYHHFESLDDVVVAVIVEGEGNPALDGDLQIFLQSESPSITDFLNYVEKRLYEVIHGKLDLFAFDAKVLPKVIANEYIRNEIQKKNNEWIDRIVKAITSGRRNMRDEILVNLIASTASGLVFKYLVHQNRQLVKAQWAMFKSMALTPWETSNT